MNGEKMETRETIKENEINIGLVLIAVKKFWYVLLIATLLLGIIGAAYTYLFKSDSYTASSSFWVNGGGTSNISSNALMASNYTELIDTDGLLRRAVSNKDGISTGKPLNEAWNCTVDEAVRRLRALMSASMTSDDTCIFSITVRSTNKEVAYQAIDAVQYALPGYIADELDQNGNFPIQMLNQVHSIEDVTLVSRPVLRNAAIFGAIGALLSLGFCILVAIYKPEVLFEKKENSPDKNEEN